MIGTQRFVSCRFPFKQVQWWPSMPMARISCCSITYEFLLETVLLYLWRWFTRASSCSSDYCLVFVLTSTTHLMTLVTECVSYMLACVLFSSYYHQVNVPGADGECLHSMRWVQYWNVGFLLVLLARPELTPLLLSRCCSDTPNQQWGRRYEPIGWRDAVFLAQLYYLDANIKYWRVLSRSHWLWGVGWGEWYMIMLFVCCHMCCGPFWYWHPFCRLAALQIVQTNNV
jgi:hypothetical protein